MNPPGFLSHPSGTVSSMNGSVLSGVDDAALCGTGIDLGRALELAQGADPANPTEAAVVGPLRAGWEGTRLPGPHHPTFDIDDSDLPDGGDDAGAVGE